MADRSSAWFWAGIGCLTLVILFAVCTAGAGYFVVRTGKTLVDEMKDPERRAESAADVLGCETLPEGYYPVVGIDLPFSLMRVAVLSDTPPRDDGEPGAMAERGFVYVDLIARGAEDDSVRAYFEGRSDDASVLREHNINVDESEIVDRGVIDLDEVDYLYLATRGRIHAQEFGGQGLSSITLVDCPDDARLRFAIWFGPDPDPDAPFESLDLSGTPADAAAIEAFLGQFSLCR